ncbi:uncharacterized protein LOC115386296 isoform X2 [Salarias fasciatus]|nr:uncharacterized protein LOC115386296 isoform X2 [Salarias fasciatus]
MDGHWKKEKKTIASLAFVNPDYEKKVVFSRENFSLCINELTDSDSGVYEALFTDSKYSSHTETHHVTVEGMVPPPVVVVHASNLSAGSCNITVNCSIQDDWATSHCDADGCKTSQTSTHTFNISIFTEKRTAVCRGNNYVSTNHEIVNIDDCFSHQRKPQKHPTSHHILILIMVCCLVCVCVLGLALRCYHHPRRSPAPPKEGQPVQTPSQEEAEVSTPSSCYENAGQPRPTASPTQQPGSLESPTADTIYAFPNVAASAGKRDGRKDTGQENTPSTSQSVTVHETQRPEVDTVYCLLQLPGK